MTIRAAASPPWTAFAFALTPNLVGSIPPALVFTLNPNAASSIGLDVLDIPVWIFVAVWTVNYLGIGLAAWLLWRRRAQTDIAVPIGVLAVCYLITISFWTTNSLRMTATLDAINLTLAWTMVWVCSRYSRAAALWLLPWALWMLITLAIKLLALGRGLS